MSIFDRFFRAKSVYAGPEPMKNKNNTKFAGVYAGPGIMNSNRKDNYDFVDVYAGPMSPDDEPEINEELTYPENNAEPQEDEKEEIEFRCVYAGPMEFNDENNDSEDSDEVEYPGNNAEPLDDEKEERKFQCVYAGPMPRELPKDFSNNATDNKLIGLGMYNVVPNSQTEISKPVLSIEGDYFCTCGAKVEFSGKFCPECGALVIRDESKITQCSCGAIYSNETHFCPNCGNKTITSDQTKVCSCCGAELSDGQKFCPECGAVRETK